MSDEDSTDIKYFDEYDEPDFSALAPLSKPRNLNIGGKRRKTRPKVESDWNDEDIHELINLVENRRPLWDKENVDHKQSKENLWEQIQDEFKGKYSWIECKAKWFNLRVTFKTNVNKLLSKKSSQDGSKKIPWRFFERMSFLEANNEYQNEQSIQSKTYDPLYTDTEQTVLSEPEVQDQATSLDEPSTVTQLPETHRKRVRPIARSTTFSSPTSPDFKMIAAQALIALTKRENKSKYKIFGEYIAAELQSLPEYQADYVKRKLNRVFLDLIDEAASMPPT